MGLVFEDKQLNFNEMLFGDSRRLSHIRRYASVPVNQSENVAEHSFYVSYYCMLIAKDLVKRGIVRSEEIDWEFLMTATIIHDIDEALTGDVLRAVKRHNNELHNMWGKMCQSVVGELSHKVGIDFRFEWDHDKDMDMVEGWIITLADFLSVISYATSELELGNLNMIRVLEECTEYITTTFKAYTKKDNPYREFLLYLYDELNYKFRQHNLKTIEVTL